MTKTVPFELESVRTGVRTLADAIAQSLRESIMKRDIRPGEPLRQSKLAEAFGVSQAPVREALRALASEGLVELASHRRAIVARLTVSELDEIYCIISALESAAARKAVANFTDDSIAEMRRHLEEMGQLTDNPVKWYQANEAFHRTLLTAAGWSRMMQICDHCRRNIGRYVTYPEIFDACVERWYGRNAMLFQACERRDAEGAVVALEMMRDISISEIRNYLLKESSDNAAA